MMSESVGFRTKRKKTKATPQGCRLGEWRPSEDFGNQATVGVSGILGFRIEKTLDWEQRIVYVGIPGHNRREKRAFVRSRRGGHGNDRK